MLSKPSREPKRGKVAGWLLLLAGLFVIGGAIVVKLRGVMGVEEAFYVWPLCALGLFFVSAGAIQLRDDEESDIVN